MDQFLECIKDVECTKIAQLSKILTLLNNSSNQNYVYEKLLAEKLLLRGEIVQNLIREKDEDVNNIRNLITGKVSINKVQFRLSNSESKSNETSYYVLILSNGLDVKSSQVVEATNGWISFPETFRFNVNDMFKIKLEIYSMSLKLPSKLFGIIHKLPKKSTNTTVSKVFYKNVYTHDSEEKDVMKSSFKLSGQTEILPTNFKKKSWLLTLGLNSAVHSVANFSVDLEDFQIHIHRSGFLTLGLYCRDFINWDLCWCNLKGIYLNIYKSPSDESNADPILQLNFRNCQSKNIEVTSRTCCARSRCFTIDERKKEGDVMRYFFRADCYDDLRMWISDVNSVLSLLDRWKYIPFK